MAHDIAARIQALEAQMQVLQDREAVRALRYHQCTNEGKLAEIPELFTDRRRPGLWLSGQSAGPGRVDRTFRRRLPALVVCQAVCPQQRMEHDHDRSSSCSTILHAVELEEDAGTGFSYRVSPTCVAARCTDEYARENGRWKFKRYISPHTSPCR